MKKTKKLIIFGDSAFAQVAYEYFTHDSPYKVVAFTVSKKFLTHTRLFGLPVVQFENLKKKYPPKRYELFVALVYTRLNRNRAAFFLQGKKIGYRMASYISSRAFVWKNVKLGEHVFIFEDNTVQPFAKIGDNTILWSGNHIGHHSIVGNHCFISSHVVISGFCIVGDYSFLGVNSSMNDRIIVAPDTVLGSGAVIIKNTEKGKVYVGNPGKPLEKSSYEVFGVKI